MDRRRFLHAAALMAASTPLLPIAAAPARAATGPIDIEAILNDPRNADRRQPGRRRHDRRVHGLQLPILQKIFA